MRISVHEDAICVEKINKNARIAELMRKLGRRGPIVSGNDCMSNGLNNYSLKVQTEVQFNDKLWAARPPIVRVCLIQLTDSADFIAANRRHRQRAF